MNAHEAIKIGEEIALRHKRNVLEIMEMGASPEKALDGCIVSLAAEIMKVIQDAENDAIQSALASEDERP